MKFTLALTAVAGFAAASSSVRRDLQPMLDSFTEIISATKGLGSALSTFETADDASLNTLLDASNLIVEKLAAGVETVKAQPQLTTLDEAIQLLAPDRALLREVTITINALYAKKALLVEQGLGSIVQDTIENINAPAIEFHEITVSKVPQEAQAIADEQGQQILAVLQQAVDNFQDLDAPAPEQLPVPDPEEPTEPAPSSSSAAAAPPATTPPSSSAVEVSPSTGPPSSATNLPSASAGVSSGAVPTGDAPAPTASAGTTGGAGPAPSGGAGASAPSGGAGPAPSGGATHPTTPGASQPTGAKPTRSTVFFTGGAALPTHVAGMGALVAAVGFAVL